MALHISAYLLSICKVIRIVLVSLPFTRAEQVHVIIEWCFQRPTRLCSTVTCSSLKTLGLAALYCPYRCIFCFSKQPRRRFKKKLNTPPMGIFQKCNATFEYIFEGLCCFRLVMSSLCIWLLHSQRWTGRSIIVSVLRSKGDDLGTCLIVICNTSDCTIL